MKTLEINLRDIKSSNMSVFTGRPQGEEIRRVLKLDNLDKETDLNVKVIIPKDTTSFNPSFFLGLFYPSIKTLGGVEEFNKKYSIIIENDNKLSRQVLERNIQDGFRNAQNSINNKTGLSLFK